MYRTSKFEELQKYTMIVITAVNWAFSNKHYKSISSLFDDEKEQSNNILRLILGKDVSPPVKNLSRSKNSFFEDPEEFKGNLIFKN